MCKHPRTLKISAKCPDGFFVTFPNGEEADRYSPPEISGLVYGEYVELCVCIDCSKIIGMASPDEILAVQPEPKTPPPPTQSLVEVCQVCGSSPPCPDWCPSKILWTIGGDQHE